MISNQSGIARGIITKEQVDFVNHKINELLSEGNAEIDKYYYCPHHPEFNSSEECNCRKPSPELIYQASKEFDIDLKEAISLATRLVIMSAPKMQAVNSFS